MYTLQISVYIFRSSFHNQKPLSLSSQTRNEFLINSHYKTLNTRMWFLKRNWRQFNIPSMVSECPRTLTLPICYTFKKSGDRCEFWSEEAGCTKMFWLSGILGWLRKCACLGRVIFGLLWRVLQVWDGVLKRGFEGVLKWNFKRVFKFKTVF